MRVIELQVHGPCQATIRRRSSSFRSAVVHLARDDSCGRTCCTTRSDQECDCPGREGHDLGSRGPLPPQRGGSGKGTHLPRRQVEDAQADTDAISADPFHSEGQSPATGVQGGIFRGSGFTIALALASGDVQRRPAPGDGVDRTRLTAGRSSLIRRPGQNGSGPESPGSAGRTRSRTARRMVSDGRRAARAVGANGSNVGGRITGTPVMSTALCPSLAWWSRHVIWLRSSPQGRGIPDIRVRAGRVSAGPGHAWSSAAGA
jgi:hypothetical protein